jgi:hypothetical protein
MKTLSVLAVTAALIATGAAAQGVSGRGGLRQDSAAADHSDVRHVAKPKEHVARPRGSSAFASAPASAFDGSWSIVIQTQVGDCDRAYRFGVEIQDGQVLNAGNEPVTLEGRVAPNGTVRVSVAAGDQEAHGAGRLSPTSGGGAWRGQGSRGACAGTWVAERRE